MIINKAVKANLSDRLADLQEALDGYNALSLQVKEEFDIDLFNEIQNNILEYRGYEDKYLESVNSIIQRLQDAESRKLMGNQEYTDLLRSAFSHVRTLEEFVARTQEVKLTFDFSATKANVADNIAKVIDYVQDFTVPESVTGSGRDFIKTYLNKVVVNARTHLGLLGLFDTREYDNHLYNKLIWLYYDLVDEKEPSDDIFSVRSDRSPQKFLNDELKPSKVKANLTYFVEHFKTETLMKDDSYEEAVGEYNMVRMTDLSNIIFERWKATNPKNYSDAYYEYISPVSSHFTELIRHSKESWDDLLQSTIERKFLFEMQKFNYIGSWVLLWKYAKAKGMLELMEACERALVERIDKPSSRKRSYENYANFNKVVAEYIFN